MLILKGGIVSARAAFVPLKAACTDFTILAKGHLRVARASFVGAMWNPVFFSVDIFQRFEVGGPKG